MNKTHINLLVNPMPVNTYTPEETSAHVSFARKINELSVTDTVALSSLWECTERNQGNCGRQSVRVGSA